MNTDDKRKLIDRYVSAYNSFDIDEMMAVIHDEVEFKNVSGGTVTATATGKADLRRMAELAKTVISSHQQTITDFKDDGERTEIEVHYRGVLAADLPSGMKKGQVLELAGRSEFTFQDGLIRRITDIID